MCKSHTRVEHLRRVLVAICSMFSSSEGFIILKTSPAMISSVLPSVRLRRPKLTFISSVVGDDEKRLMAMSKFALLDALYG
jgi:hypothetical protein